jgi:hypothetical protein
MAGFLHHRCHSTSIQVLSTGPSLLLKTTGGDQKAQQAVGATRQDVHGEGFLASQLRAEVGHRLVEIDQTVLALDEPSRLPQGHAE